MGNYDNNRSNSNVELKIPYDFVPLSSWVYIPEWAYQVSQDVPLPGALDGSIELELTNATELCVGSEHKGDDNKTVCFEKNPDGYPVIPGTTLKGMLRNVMTAATFGKFAQVEERKYSERDISSSNTDYAQDFSKHDVKPGWLRYNQKNKKWEACFGEWIKIYHKDLDDLFKCPKKAGECFSDMVEHSGNSKAIDKYELKGCPALTTDCRDIFSNFSVYRHVGKSACYEYAAPKPKNDGDTLKEPVSKLGEIFLVLSNERPGKKETYDYSYLFYGRDPSKTSEIASEKVTEFFNAHSDNRLGNSKLKEKDNNLLDYMRFKHDCKIGMPVWFWQEPKGASNGKVDHIGLCRMSRRQCEHSIWDLAKNQQTLCQAETVRDLPSIIFGSIIKNPELSQLGLKSRVYFSDLTCTQSLSQLEDNVLKVSDMIMGSPKSSFIVSYLTSRNSEGEGVRSYNDNYPKVMLSGLKRYKVQSKFVYPNGEINGIKQIGTLKKLDETQEGKDKKNVQTSAEFLPKNTTFKGKLVFHNLTPQELGALIWTIRMGDNEQTPEDNKHYHSMGFAKPYGAGAVTLKITDLKFASYVPTTGRLEPDKFMDRFIDLMNEKYLEILKNKTSSKGWLDSPQVKYLLDFAKMHKDNEGDSVEIYNVLDRKEFSALRQNMETRHLPELSDTPRKEPELKPDCSMIEDCENRLVALLKSSVNRDEQKIKDLTENKQRQLETLKKIQEEAVAQEEAKREREAIEAIPDPVERKISLLKLDVKLLDKDLKSLSDDEKLGKQHDLEKYKKEFKKYLEEFSEPNANLPEKLARMLDDMAKIGPSIKISEIIYFFDRKKNKKDKELLNKFRDSYPFLKA